MAFDLEPKNVTVGVGHEAYFPCKYNGSNILPYWNISKASGWDVVPTNRLPLKHYFNGTGLIVMDVDESHNMTSFSCIFQVFDHDSLTIVNSVSGTLIVLEDISFHLELNGIHISERVALREGDPTHTLRIVKSGHSFDSYLVLLSVVGEHEGYCGKKWYT